MGGGMISNMDCISIPVSCNHSVMLILIQYNSPKSIFSCCIKTTNVFTCVFKNNFLPKDCLLISVQQTTVFDSNTFFSKLSFVFITIRQGFTKKISCWILSKLPPPPLPLVWTTCTTFFERQKCRFK